MAILVTGGTGFVGLNLVEALLARGDSVVILSNGPLPGMAEPVFARLPGRLTVIAGDVRDARLVGDAVRRHGIERIVAYVTFFTHSALPGTTPWSPAGVPSRSVCCGRRWMPRS